MDTGQTEAGVGAAKARPTAQPGEIPHKLIEQATDQYAALVQTIEEIGVHMGVGFSTLKLQAAFVKTIGCVPLWAAHNRAGAEKLKTAGSA